MFALLRAAVLALAVLFPLAVPAHGWGHHRRATAASYYYAAPVSYYYSPAIPVIYSQPAPVVAAPIYAPAIPPVYAVPTPAPAISLPAPTAPPPMPPAGVKESRSPYPESGSYYLAPATVVASRTVPVAFWNRSNRDVWVWIAGERRWLRQGRGLTVDLPREFTWQVHGGNPQQERIADSQSTGLIVIR